MNIKSAKFVKGIVGDDEILHDGKTQIAFIGRSNVGKSSTINALTKQKKLARISSFPGCTQQINLFLINESFYLVDLPGYGYAKISKQSREELGDLVSWYLFEFQCKSRKIMLIVDANVGLTASDMDTIFALDEAGKEVIIIANKVDKIKKSEYVKKLKTIQIKAGKHKVIPYSAEKGTGIGEVVAAMME